MARQTTKKAKRPAGVGLDAYLGKQLEDPEFRHHYEQRRLVHEVAIVVRSMREQASLTQAQLAKLVGVSQPMIARMERGLDQRTPRWETLRRIGLALGKQLKLSFVEADGDEPLVELDGMPPRSASPSAERRP
ncbi:MAG TPA: helix-turn-helix transcriptional regulator [Anaeromyxobacteraceae bacterium]|nr:helix-turn-helix transcriptional regulator [Anaeromyxobacteraceae bacterium]